MKPSKNKPTLTKTVLMGTAAAMFLAAAPVNWGGLSMEAALAQGQGSGGSGGSGGGNSDGGGSGGGSGGDNARDGSGGQGSSAGQGGAATGGSGSGSSDSGSGGSGGSGQSSGGASSGGSSAGGSSAGGGTSSQSGGTQAGSGQAAGGQPGVMAERDEDKSMSDIFADLTGEPDDDSDRPDWAGVPGGKDGAGGGQPSTAGSTKGDLFGDLWVILRDDNGIPLLTDEGWVQPLDADGNLIPLDEEGHPVDETLTIEVELGRLNVGRAPTQVLDRRADEVIALMNSATDLTLDPAGRLVFTVDGVEKTIDSPLENLAIYKALLTTGTIPGVDDLPGTEFDFMVDGEKTVEDLIASAAFLAAATDKTGVFTEDEIAYINAFIGVNVVVDGNVIYSDIDYSDFTYDRQDTYGDVTTEVLVKQDDGSWLPTVVNIYDAVFGGEAVEADGDLSAYTVAADDARTVVNYIHEYEVPVDDILASAE